MGTVTRPFGEEAARFGRHGSLVGVVTEPIGSVGADRPDVVFLNSGIIHRVGANRIYVRLARALARRGVRCLRFDLSGIGDSALPDEATGVPLAEVVRADIDDALAFLEERGATRFVLAGLCSGADHALEVMADDERVVGGVLMDPFAFHTSGYYVRYFGSRVMRPSAWRTLVTGGPSAVGNAVESARELVRSNATNGNSSGLGASSPPTKEEMVRRLEGLLARDARLLYAFTAGIEERYNYEGQFYDAFPDLDFKDCVRLEYFPDSDHRFSPVTAQDRLEALVVDWYGTHWRCGAKADQEVGDPAPRGAAPSPRGPQPNQSLLATGSSLPSSG